VKSTLSCGNEDVKKTVKLVVEQVSITESLGNAVFTMAALSFFHDHPKESFPEECYKGGAVPSKFRPTTKL
jgi:hypothetical protein